MLSFHCIGALKTQFGEIRLEAMSFLGLRQIEFHLVLYLQSTSNAGQEYGETCAAKIIKAMQSEFYV